MASAGTSDSKGLDGLADVLSALSNAASEQPFHDAAHESDDEHDPNRDSDAVSSVNKVGPALMKTTITRTELKKGEIAVSDKLVGKLIPCAGVSIEQSDRVDANMIVRGGNVISAPPTLAALANGNVKFGKAAEFELRSRDEFSDSITFYKHSSKTSGKITGTKSYYTTGKITIPMFITERTNWSLDAPPSSSICFGYDSVLEYCHMTNEAAKKTLKGAFDTVVSKIQLSEAYSTVKAISLSGLEFLLLCKHTAKEYAAHGKTHNALSYDETWETFLLRNARSIGQFYDAQFMSASGAVNAVSAHNKLEAKHKELSAKYAELIGVYQSLASECKGLKQFEGQFKASSAKLVHQIKAGGPASQELRFLLPVFTALATPGADVSGEFLKSIKQLRVSNGKAAVNSAAAPRPAPSAVVKPSKPAPSPNVYHGPAISATTPAGSASVKMDDQ